MRKELIHKSVFAFYTRGWMEWYGKAHFDHVVEDLLVKRQNLLEFKIYKNLNIFPFLKRKVTYYKC